ncbi:hypothetical protein GT347_08850 [Xylophilus rhododendri]|uniref:Uncharacterized protein n=1 Tax=Xylophilus rhododendri TaxID=2697032 RepID=A0A857J4Y4_9BURK|nr:hypothetical protein [Xylophilus rhododendri]QHI98092.1 hypothetical protein GT347_08850 [Xylophilus rhododendri]
MLYPASNLPAMWALLGPLIQQSPTLVFQLDRLQKTGWRIEWAAGGAEYCDWAQRTLHLRGDVSPLYAMQALAHEVRHALQRPGVIRQYPSEQAYANLMLSLEDEAVVNHLQVRWEIMRATGIDIGIVMKHPAYYDAVFSLYLKHRDVALLLSRIRMMHGWESSSLTGTCYWEASVNEWRQQFGLPPIRISPQLVEQGQALAWRLLRQEKQRLQAGSVTRRSRPPCLAR